MEKSIREIFARIPDSRVKGRCLHKVSDILFIALCTLLSNGEDFEDMVTFAKERHEWLLTKIELPNGIPSHDTFNRVLQLIDPELFSRFIQEDGASLLDHVAEHVINLDGKKIRGVSPHSRGNRGLYILSAWVGEHNLCIGQLKVEDKSNEITAIPQVLREIDLVGNMVTIDAIGCQKEIAQQIDGEEGYYLLAVKGNQADLLEEVSEVFTFCTIAGDDQTWEYDHGRYEERRCQVLDARKALSPNLLNAWPSVQTLVKIEATRETGDVINTNTRYYISNKICLDACYFNGLARSHWSIENALHWHLDVTFAEDASRARSGNAPQNLNILRKVALRRLKKDDTKLSQKKRRFKASLNRDYLDHILGL